MTQLEQLKFQLGDLRRRLTTGFYNFDTKKRLKSKIRRIERKIETIKHESNDDGAFID